MHLFFFLVFKEPRRLLCQHPRPSRTPQRYDIFLYRASIFVFFCEEFVLKFITRHYSLFTNPQPIVVITK